MIIWYWAAMPKFSSPPDRGGFNADVTVVKGTPKLLKYKVNKRSYDGVTNPWLVVEVLSTSTRRFDLTEKLGDYQKIESLQQIIFVEQGSLWASTFIRTSENEWQKTEFTRLDEKIPVAHGFLEMEKIFAKVF